ncbi:MAG: phage terminase large subunit [Desulfocucumaceae bacterium]
MELKLKGYPNPKQKDFFLATARHIAYGGARGGGKSWAMRRKFVLLALNYAGLKLLLLRRTLPELRENHILPLLAELNKVAKYSDNEKAFIFPTGSRIKLGYCDAERDIYQYQGQEYDVIGLEEATHFTEAQKDFMTTCNRSVRPDFKPRMYYTANPGNVGHQWFKRLFIDREYRGKEVAEDYVFIPARVYDNKVLMDNNPEYVQTLENLPDDLRRAHLEGDWYVFAGQYFKEFDREIHTIDHFVIPADWRRYIALDYGLDMLAAYWIATDSTSKAYVYKELYQSGLIISDAAKAILAMTTETIYEHIAPPDLWNKRQETGKSAAEIFDDNGVTLYKANNNRIQGWYNLKEWLKPYEDEFNALTASLVITKNCTNLIRTLPQLQCDEKDPNDVATEPHELTHGPDALRYFVAARPCPDMPKMQKPEGKLIDKLQPKPKRGMIF